MKLPRFGMTILSALVTLLLGMLAVATANAGQATVGLSCNGTSPSAQVALRWGHPNYNSTPLDPTTSILKVPCQGTIEHAYNVSAKDSQFEIQTEGGAHTGYEIHAQITDRNSRTHVISLIHQPDMDKDPQVSDSRITLTRSAGPNVYGEQNFRVKLSPDAKPTVKIEMNGNNFFKTGQVALTWGHPDFNNAAFLHPSPWKLKVNADPQIGPGLDQQFKLDSANSEFEIQTEGGVETSYLIKMWFDFGTGFPAQPSVVITHHPSVQISTDSPDMFKSSEGNQFGEIDVRVTDPNF
jgi:hypothetical protein